MEMSSRRLSGDKLGWYDRLALAFHLLICGGCRFVDRQFALIDRMARRLGAPHVPRYPVSSSSEKLSEEAKDKLREVIR